MPPPLGPVYVPPSRVEQDQLGAVLRRLARGLDGAGGLAPEICAALRGQAPQISAPAAAGLGWIVAALAAREARSSAPAPWRIDP